MVQIGNNPFTGEKGIPSVKEDKRTCKISVAKGDYPNVDACMKAKGYVKY